MLLRNVLQTCHSLLNIKQNILDAYCCILSMKEWNAMISRGIPNVITITKTAVKSQSMFPH